MPHSITKMIFFFMNPPNTEIYTLSLHDALPILAARHSRQRVQSRSDRPAPIARAASSRPRSEEHTSELQSPYDLVCRLLLEKKKSYPSSSRQFSDNTSS